MKEMAKANPKSHFAKIKIINTKDNTTIIVEGYKAASEITGVSIYTIKKIINWNIWN